MKNKGLRIYQPQFHYTDYLTFLLSEINALRQAIEQAPLIPQWEVKLRREALLESVQASTSIEGNSLDLNEVSQVLLNQKSIGTRHEQKEVQNYFQTLLRLEKLKSKAVLEPKDVIQIHNWIMKGLPNAEPTNEFRKVPVAIGNPKTRKISYLAPPAKVVPALTTELLEWYQRSPAHLNPIIKAAVCHYRLVWIHPFVDGNGRSARALATLVLLRENFDIKRFFTLDDYYDADRTAYYQAIQKTNLSEDLSEWLVYFAEGVKQSLEAVKRKIDQLTNHLPKLTPPSSQIVVSKREEEVLRLLVSQPKLTSQDFQEKFKISRQAVAKLTSKMIKKGLLRGHQHGRSTFYTLG
ncbi:MAG: Fic family protein [Patescibacteria group bacterium]